MSSILKVDTIQTAAGGTPTAADLGLNVSGSVLQVVSSTTNTTVQITGSSYVDSALSASITPLSTSSKIVVLVNQSAYLYGSSDAVHSGIRLLRDSTVILNPFADSTGGLEPYLEVIGSSQVYFSSRHTISYVDTPSTTSSVTYKTQGALRSSGFSRNLVFQPPASVNGTSTITLMEIAG